MGEAMQGSGALAFWADVPAAEDADFNEWYNREHFPERLGVPGFRLGARYRALRGGPGYFAWYLVDSLAVLTSPPYLERLNDPTPWTQRIMGLVQNAIRTAFAVKAQAGEGRGGVAGVLRLEPAPGREAALEQGLAGGLAERVLAMPGIVAMLCLQGEPDASGVGTEERRLRGDTDAMVAWALIVEGNDEAAVEAALAAYLGEAQLEALGAAPGAAVGLYRLLHARRA